MVKSSLRKAIYRTVEETGNVYGRLTVLKPAPPRGSVVGKWECLCECGNITAVSGVNLRRGGSLSCGCLRRELVSLPFGESNKRRVIRNTIKNARNRGLAWNLSDKQVIDLLVMDCHYCGSPPAQVSRSRGSNGSFVYNGLDRVDNSKGYDIANVVTCCGICNHAKSDMSLVEFNAWIGRVYSRTWVL